jgi:predicted ATPase
MNQANPRAHLTKLTLGGFQVFDQVTDIPLGNLTFLFGPNSAGKSAVQDALELLSDLLEGDEWDRDKLRRHWRRAESGEYVQSMTLGFTATNYVSFADALCLSMHLPPSDDWETNPSWNGEDISPLFEFQLSDDDVAPTNVRPKYTLRVSGQDILQVEPHERLGINFDHPIIRSVVLQNNFRHLAVWSACFEAAGAWVFLRSRFAGVHGPATIHKEILVEGAILATIDVAGLGEMDRSRVAFAEWSPAVSEFLSFFDEIQSIALGGNIKFKPHVVPASRQTPSADELTFHLSSDTRQFALPSLDKGANPDHLPLVRSTYEASTATIGLQVRGDASTHLHAGGWNEPGWLFHRVNQALAGHLFAETGYAVAADVRLLVDINDVTEGSGYQQFNLADHDAIVRLSLRDHSGRRHEFRDVGSGIGYVLPVLTSVCDLRLAVSLLQQPELHLHPALQASLADVFIEHASHEHQILAETHSEHLLLRVLKRIRQTASGHHMDPAFCISPEQVVVAYFDPRPDGTTVVKRLRISEDGDFLDRWPRGFFTERDSELFDE